MFTRVLIVVLEFLCNEDRCLQLALSILSAVGGFVLCHDVIQVAIGKVDLNQHIPFLVPAVLSAFVGMGWYVLTRQPGETPRI